ncbi:hypothetical protein DFH08DRAFT_636630, partial [Mycena albidolilacea]
ESEDEVRPGGKRGPKSQTRDHYWPPVAVNANGEKRWSFKCRHCKHTVSFKRMVGKDQLFGDEKPAPALGNLATHYKQHHHGILVPSDVQPGETRGVSASSAKIMADFLVEGKINPAINSTQKNFLKVFTAWIIEDDLPFTTGETPGIQRLFAFLQTRYGLPSDTALRKFVLPLNVASASEPRLSESMATCWLHRDGSWHLLCLSMFTKVTRQMSHSSTPTLPWVLPMYEGMRKHLQASEENAKFGSLRTAAAAGLENLEFYYSKASDCQLNIIAT